MTPSPAGSRSSLAGAALAGVLLVLAPCPFLLACAGVSHGQPAGWRLLGAAAAVVFLLAAALLLVRKSTAAKGSALLALAASALIALPGLVRDPLSALAGGVVFIQATSSLLAVCRALACQVLQLTVFPLFCGLALGRGENTKTPKISALRILAPESPTVC